MSVAEMKEYIVQHLSDIDDATRLEQIVEIIKEDEGLKISMKQFFESAVNRYGNVLQKLAE